MSELTIEQRMEAALYPEAPAEEQSEDRAESSPDQSAAEQSEEQPEATEVAEPESTPEAEAASEAEELEVETLAELAEHFNIDPADLYQLKVPVTMADGTKAEVSLGEWKDGYKTSQDAQVEARRAAEARQELEARQTALEAEWRGKVQDAAATLQVAETNLNADFNSVDWNALRETDPAEWSAKRQQFAERNAQLQQAKREIAERWQQHEAQTQESQQQQLAEHLETERQLLMRALPEWADEATAEKERSDLSNYLMKSGFASNEVSSVSDHRLVVMARKAMLYDQQVRTADAAKKRVIKIGKKSPKPGARISQAEQQQDAIRPLREKFRKSGRIEDGVALLEARRQQR